MLYLEYVVFGELIHAIIYKKGLTHKAHVSSELLPGIQGVHSTHADYFWHGFVLVFHSQLDFRPLHPQSHSADPVVEAGGTPQGAQAMA